MEEGHVFFFSFFLFFCSGIIVIDLDQFLQLEYKRSSVQIQFYFRKVLKLECKGDVFIDKRDGYLAKAG